MMKLRLSSKLSSCFGFLVALFLLTGCFVEETNDEQGLDNDDDNENAVENQQALLDRINQQFPFVPNQPIDVIYGCQRLNSNLTYIFDFQSNGDFDLYSLLDNNDVVMRSGTYTYQNDEIHMLSTNNFLSLDERSIVIEDMFGLLYRFETDNMACVAIGHRYNNQAFVSPVNYRCPSINIQAVSYDINAIEFAHQAILNGVTVPGSAFRQRDREISGATQPNIQRGYGIYRRVGDDFYVYFNGIFDDVNVLSGTFVNNYLEISVEQLEPAAGNCLRQ